MFNIIVCMDSFRCWRRVLPDRAMIDQVISSLIATFTTDSRRFVHIDLMVQERLDLLDLIIVHWSLVTRQLRAGVIYIVDAQILRIRLLLERFVEISFFFVQLPVDAIDYVFLVLFIVFVSRCISHEMLILSCPLVRVAKDIDNFVIIFIDFCRFKINILMRQRAQSTIVPSRSTCTTRQACARSRL